MYVCYGELLLASHIAQVLDKILSVESDAVVLPLARHRAGAFREVVALSATTPVRSSLQPVGGASLSLSLCTGRSSFYAENGIFRFYQAIKAALPLETFTKLALGRRNIWEYTRSNSHSRGDRI